MALFKKTITEKDCVHKEWYEQAADKSMTLKKLPKFLNHLMNDYNHDYGTVVHALTAGGIATMWAMNRTPQGGITGFQAECVMWQFIREWMHMKGSLKLVDYDDLLFPQCEDKFDKVISPTVWADIQKKAAEKLQSPGAHADVRKHWQSIVDGKVPFGYKIKED